ncbi:hypothetical protein IFM89_006833 [Coptis chinensis]|uniref:Uncharacterized protein n=1 Tax=Coptis chinensis TaxID=261450 RepID=A0A835IB60_9MAGN|nr:hypothetical protein IFM89_006833 [Coptis chinensis]
MSSCISGGGRAYGFDIDIVKSPSTSSRTSHSHSSSPSSTISESINSPLALSTRKPRTPRKRPNQTYNEAAALLSTVYPNIFSPKNLKKPNKHTKPYSSCSSEFAELLPPSPTFNNVEFLLHQPNLEKPTLRIEMKTSTNSRKKLCQTSPPISPCEEDFDADSILDEEVEEGIDSIMGNLSVENDCNTSQFSPYFWDPMAMGGGFSMGGKFDFGYGINGSVSAWRQTDDVDWWRFPTVDVLAISPKLNKVSCEKKKKKKKVERVEELKISESSKEIVTDSNSNSNSSSSPNSDSNNLGLKLDYEKVLNAWSDRGSPFSDDILGTESSESDAIARLAQIDLLFSENGGVREASVLRYREKRRSRLFSKKISGGGGGGGGGSGGDDIGLNTTVVVMVVVVVVEVVVMIVLIYGGSGGGGDDGGGSGGSGGGDSLNSTVVVVVEVMMVVVVAVVVVVVASGG